jgi:hypothetical protein
MAQRIDSDGKEINVGDRVIVVGFNTVVGETFVRSFLRERKVYGIVLGEEVRVRKYVGASSEVIDFTKVIKDHFKNELLNEYSFSMKHLKVLDPKDYAEYDLYAEQANDYMTAHMKTVENLEKLPLPTESYMNRSFVHKDINLLSTKLNCVAEGEWNKDDNTFKNDRIAYLVTCCAFTKTKHDLEVYIPELWLRYYKYTMYDLGEWLKFLAKCGIGFEYVLCGPSKLHNVFYENFEKPIDDGYYKKVSPKALGSLMYPNGPSGYIKLRMKGCKDDPMITYLRFICLRYIYNQAYWTIPGHAMQIKRSLGNAVTYWQALLMAHLYKTYDGYYSLANQHDFDPQKPYQADRAFPFSTSSNYDRHINPFQSREDVFKRLNTPLASMNRAFSYSCDAFKREDLNKFFIEKDYVGLFKYIRDQVGKSKVIVK